MRVLTITVNDSGVTVFEQKTPLAAASPFTDVKESDWYFNAVNYVYGNSLMNGTSDSLFSPNTTLTRAMVVTIIHRLDGSPDVTGLFNEFSDVNENSWYTKAVSWAVENGIASGYGDGRFGSEDLITRQDLAVILERYMDYKGIVLPVTDQWIIFADEASIAGYAMGAIQTFNKLGVISGTGTNDNGQTIVHPKGNATRAQAAVMLMRFIEAINQ